MIKKTYTYSKNEVAYAEKYNWSFFFKGSDSSPKLKKNSPIFSFSSKKKKSPEQRLSRITTERKISNPLRDDELKKHLNEELFTSFQEIEENFTIPNMPIRGKAIEKIDKQKLSEENQSNIERETTLTDYINVLEHSLLVEDINGRVQSKNAKNGYDGEFQDICFEVEPSLHACSQALNDGPTSDYVSNDQLLSLKCQFSEDKAKYNNISYKSNFPENHSDIGIRSLKTSSHKESLPGFEIKSFQYKSTSEVCNFDCLENTSIQDYLCLESEKKQKAMNKSEKKNQVASACFPEDKEQLRRQDSKKNLNKRTRSMSVRKGQFLAVAQKKWEFNKKIKIYSGERSLKFDEYAPIFNNHSPVQNGQPNFLISNTCGSENSLLTQGDIQSKRKQEPMENKSKQCTISDGIVFSKVKKPSKIITYRKNLNKSVQSIEQTLVTVKKKQNIQGVNAQTEEKTLIKALTAARNSNHISIKSSVLTSKQMNYKCISSNTSNKKQLKCSTPVNVSKYVAVPFHYLSSINSEESIKSPSFLSMQKKLTIQQRPFISGTDSAVTNSYRTQKFILNQIDRSLSFTTVIDDKNQDFIKLLSHCEHGKIVPFLKAYAWSDLLCTKVGEGSYGEVFSLANEKMTVLKIIPLAVLKSQSGQNISCKDVMHEILVCRYMNSLSNSLYNSCSNFIKMNKVTCTSGSFPSQLKRAWCRFKKIHKNKSFNPHPGTYIDDQLFIIFEFEFGGETLEKYKIKSASEALSIFHQITMSLAVAEVECLFEHRDLHLSNLLITATIAECIDYHIEGTLVGVPSSNVLVKIIDFTLSRLTTQEGFVLSANINEGNSLFLQFGDEQYEIYRKTDRYLGGNWKASCLYTNILWLHYILKNILSRNSVKKADTDSEKIILHYLQSIEKELLQYKSAKDYVLKILI